MAEVIRMPKMSDTMTEGVVVAWHKKVGDKIKSGDVLAEIETDKATMELEAFEEGTLLHIGVEKGATVPVDQLIAVMGEKGEDYQHLLSDTINEEKQASDEESGSEQKTEDTDVGAIPAKIERMPKMSDTMTEGEIVVWHKKVGDEIKSGDVLAEINTDKATMELEAYEDGTLLYIGVEAGKSAKVDEILYIHGEKGADYQKLIDRERSGTSKNRSVASKQEHQEEKTEKISDLAISETERNTGSRVKISPLAKKMAEDRGLNIEKINGTGDNGRIVKRDVLAYKESMATQKSEDTVVNLPQIVAEESYEEVPLSQMRKTIAKRLAESKFQAPHFYLTMELNMDKVIEARKAMNELAEVKISFNDIVVKAVALALRKHPQVNSAWLGDKIRYNKHVHIGIAVAVEEGLLVPVVRFADNKSISHISAEIKALGKKAKEKTLQPKDWEGNTFTISNLGMFGIEEFTAIINPPEACIMAVGAIKQTAIVRDGQLVIGNVMKVTMSCDHRVVDGAVGSAFLQTFKQILENPVRMLI